MKRKEAQQASVIQVKEGISFRDAVLKIKSNNPTNVRVPSQDSTIKQPKVNQVNSNPVVLTQNDHQAGTSIQVQTEENSSRTCSSEPSDQTDLSCSTQDKLSDGKLISFLKDLTTALVLSFQGTQSNPPSNALCAKINDLFEASYTVHHFPS